MKCPECIKQGLRSTVRNLGSMKTLMSFEPWYDEDGNYHSHDGNRIQTGYKCANDHVWSTETYDKCPQGDYP